MKYLTASELRKKFLNFFAQKDHLVLPSSPLVPGDDPTLLWVNAGMAPLKPYFDGRRTPPHPRAVSIQKCLRTNDIENVGKTARHHTFFEMMGNYSFADYFKRQAILWAWEFVTEVLGLAEESLWVSVYKEGKEEDKEAARIWLEEVGINPQRLAYLGKEDNFWEIGEGPCGPCSEIYFDRGRQYSCGPECKVGCDCDRFVEIWNLVFTQYNRKADGSYEPLATKNIDTGMGLERVLAILQGGSTNYDTDLFKPYIDFLVEKSGLKYENADKGTKMAFQVIVDHIRAIVFTLAEGVLPGNEGRSYVIRRILRRAARFGRNLGLKNAFLYKMVALVVDNMGSDYPEIRERQNRIIQIVKKEEERFQETLTQGLEILQEEIVSLAKRQEKVLPGSVAFLLYDTYGFPLELTKEVLREQGLEVDEEEFYTSMEEQKARARRDWVARERDLGPGKEEQFLAIGAELGASLFTGYDKLEDNGEIQALFKEKEGVETLAEGDSGLIILNRTPFYAQGGGQVGDSGTMRAADGSRAKVQDTFLYKDLIIHQVYIEAGVFQERMAVSAKVDEKRRYAIMRNHTATHLLHKALRIVLGDHVEQAGSLVDENRLRFDFKHFQGVTDDEIRRIEALVNEQIINNHALEALETDLQEAKEMGAIAVFDEKYGAKVRVISIGDFSKELCGGTHVDHTGRIGPFKIISETGIAAGIRRLEAVTGFNSFRYLQGQLDMLDRISHMLKAGPTDIDKKLAALIEENSSLAKELQKARLHSWADKANEIVTHVEQIKGINVLRYIIEGVDQKEMRQMADLLRERLDSALIVLATKKEGKALLLTTVSQDLIETHQLHAGRIVGELARKVGGGGGGKAEMAQAGGPQGQHISKALEHLEKIIVAKKEKE